MLDASSPSTLLALTASWAAVYLMLRRSLFSRFSATFSNVVVSYIHAFVAMGLALHLSAVDWRHPFSGYGQPPTPAQMTVLSVRWTCRSACKASPMLTLCCGRGSLEAKDGHAP